MDGLADWEVEDDMDRMSDMSFGGEVHDDASQAVPAEAGDGEESTCDGDVGEEGQCDQTAKDCVKCLTFSFSGSSNTSRRQWSKLAGAVNLYGTRWRAHVDDNSDYVYYEEAATGHVQWQKPEDFDGEEIEGHLHQE